MNSFQNFYIIAAISALLITGCWNSKDDQVDDQSRTARTESKGWFSFFKKDSKPEPEQTQPEQPEETEPERLHSVVAQAANEVEEKPSIVDNFVYPNVMFWVGLIACVVLITLYAEYEEYENYRGAKLSGNFAASILFLTLVYMNLDLFKQFWDSYSWQGVATVAGLFIVTAIMNFWIKWSIKTSNALQQFKDREQEFLNDARGLNGKVYDEMPDDDKVIIARDDYFIERKWPLNLPKKAQHKALLTKWACTGPISLPGTLLVNGSRMFGTFVYNRFGFLAEMITSSHEKEIKRASIGEQK